MGAERIIGLCDEFNAACQRTNSSENHAEEVLQALDDKLWGFTKEICKGILFLGEEDLGVFRLEHFEPKVLRWCLLNSAVASLWSKPAGYSGDYRTIELICQNRRCWTRFEDIFLNHLLRSEMADQHRGKVAEQSRFITRVLNGQGRPKLLSAGCGSCFDLRVALRQAVPTRKADVVLIDLDPEATAFSKRQLEEMTASVKVSFLNEDILRAMRLLCAKACEVGTYDAVLFGGIFDYLPDRLIVLLLRAAQRLLRFGGEILFSQVSPDNPNRVFMKWYGDWELRERDEYALLRLCSDAGIPARAVLLGREQCQIAILGRVERCTGNRGALMDFDREDGANQLEPGFRS